MDFCPRRPLYSQDNRAAAVAYAARIDIHDEMVRHRENPSHDTDGSEWKQRCDEHLRVGTYMM